MNTSNISALTDRLHGCDTPTICNAIEVAQGKIWAGNPEAVRGRSRRSGPVDFETFKTLWTDFEKART